MYYISHERYTCQIRKSVSQSNSVADAVNLDGDRDVKILVDQKICTNILCVDEYDVDRASKRR